MKKWLIGLMFSVLVLACAFNVMAEPGKFHGGNGGPNKFNNGHNQRNQERDDARYILHRTAMVVFDAQRILEHRNRRSFGFAQVIANQQKAKELFLNGFYRDAIFHSLRARELAFQIIKRNGERHRREFSRDEMEERYAHNSPRGEELDLRLNLGKLGKDDDVVHFKLDIDIN